jgi:DNA-directed RNA polymerase specialized sigma subunit
LASIITSTGVELPDAFYDSIYDTLAESKRGDDEETLRLKAVTKIQTAGASNQPATTPDEINPNLYADRPKLQALKDLLLRFRSGDPQAATELISRYEHNNWQRANKFAEEAGSPVIDADDLYQEAVLGLLLAAEKADLKRVHQFNAFANSYTWGPMNSYVLSTRNTVKVPNSLGLELDKIKQIDLEAAQHGLPPLRDHDKRLQEFEVVKNYGVAVMRRLIALTHLESIEDLAATNPKDSYHNAGLDEANPSLNYQNVTQPHPDLNIETRALLADLVQQVNQVLRSDLNDSARTVINLLFELKDPLDPMLKDISGPLRPTDVSVKRGISNTRVCQIRDQALVKLKKSTKLRDLWEETLNF